MLAPKDSISPTLAHLERAKAELVNASCDGVRDVPDKTEMVLCCVNRMRVATELQNTVGPAPYLELLGRKRVRGWTDFGNQVAQ